MKNKIKQVHLSIDDVVLAFKDIIANQLRYDSIFDNTFFQKLKRLHEKYNAKVTLYLYETDKGYSLEKIPLKYWEELKKNSSWVKVGYHWRSPDFANTTDLSATVHTGQASSDIQLFTKSYMNMLDIISSVRGEDNISKVIRLHYFYGTEQMISFLKSVGVVGLLCADDDRISYNLSVEENAALLKNDLLCKEGMKYYRTHLRIEKIRFKSFIIKLLSLIGKKTIIIFTHEWALNKRNWLKLELLIIWYYINRYEFAFLEET